MNATSTNYFRLQNFVYLSFCDIFLSSHSFSETSFRIVSWHKFRIIMFVININHFLPIKLEQDLGTLRYGMCSSFVGKQELIMINLSKSLKNLDPRTSRRSFLTCHPFTPVRSLLTWGEGGLWAGYARLVRDVLKLQILSKDTGCTSKASFYTIQ